MAVLCEGDNKPPGSLKAIRQFSLKQAASVGVNLCKSVEVSVAEALTSVLISERRRSEMEDIKMKQDLIALKETIAKSLPSKETLRGHSDSSFRGEGYIQCCVGVRLCDMYSNQELAEIHFMYGKADGNAALARRLYQESYPQRQCPDRKTFVRLHYRLCEYGKLNSPGLGRGRPRSTTPEVQEEILEAVNMTPSISTRRVALQVNVPHTTVWRLLKEYQLYPYHLQRVQALSPADYPARVRFCGNHPPYSPDLAPSDFHLFGPLKKFLGGQRFGSDEEVKSVVRRWLYAQKVEFYERGVLKSDTMGEICRETWFQCRRIAPGVSTQSSDKDDSLISADYDASE
ncbi:hypothetical protein ANN_03464 [Periplaneta americana]|uniref:DUF4817 domain-containing protein n=1 Tax=Periplaneta americana TaxID=6978 RepID=A0ABQ8U4N1_PERAM|nr:hypothetical protein ANN_03464 [Periplaneta americana]